MSLTDFFLLDFVFYERNNKLISIKNLFCSRKDTLVISFIFSYNFCHFFRTHVTIVWFRASSFPSKYKFMKDQHWLLFYIIILTVKNHKILPRKISPDNRNKLDIITYCLVALLQCYIIFSVHKYAICNIKISKLDGKYRWQDLVCNKIQSTAC